MRQFVDGAASVRVASRGRAPAYRRSIKISRGVDHNRSVGLSVVRVEGVKTGLSPGAAGAGAKLDHSPEVVVPRGCRVEIAGGIEDDAGDRSVAVRLSRKVVDGGLGIPAGTLSQFEHRAAATAVERAHTAAAATRGPIKIP